MNQIAKSETEALPALVERAARTLSEARTSAEVLDARDLASVAYDAAKKAGRMARAKKAHDDLLASVYRAQADALVIESQAKARLADEYDAAQDRGEVKSLGRKSGVEDHNTTPSAADLGLRRDQIHEARKIRDAEKADPGLVQRTVDKAVDEGREPTKAEVRESVLAGIEYYSKPRRRKPPPAPTKKLGPSYPLMDDAVTFTARCRDLAEFTNAEALGNWTEYRPVAWQIKEAALQAKEVLDLFVETREKADAES